MIVTGFRPFTGFPENPSWELARVLDPAAVELEVSFEAVDRFVEGVDGQTPILMLGASSKAKRLTLELVGRNEIGPTPDVLGSVQGPGPVDPRAPRQLGGTLFRSPELLVSSQLDQSVDAGSYLCNYLYFNILWRKPGALAGFVHVPPFDVLNRDQAAEDLRALAGRLPL